MSNTASQIEQIVAAHQSASLRIQTLGAFQVWVDSDAVENKTWGRDKTVQLLQFLITIRNKRGLHKEQIIDRIWEDADIDSGNRDFKVAMHGINKVLEPNRKSRTEFKYILRQGATYQLNGKEISVDLDVIESLIAIGNDVYNSDQPEAIKAFSEAIKLYEGTYLPNRVYEDWTIEERERIQVLILGAFMTLAELVLDESPMESVRLTQRALLIDPTWEDAYRIQMRAFFNRGNRPQAIKAYEQCVKVLDQEFGISPLPETKKLLKEIKDQ